MTLKFETPAPNPAKPSTSNAVSQAPADVTSATLSSSANALKDAASALTGPAFDQAKVDSITQAIREGKFQINPEAIADKLISSAQDIVNRRSQH